MTLVASMLNIAMTFSFNDSTLSRQPPSDLASHCSAVVGSTAVRKSKRMVVIVKEKEGAI